MKVICVTNQKGGVGKTTTSTVLASIMNKLGHKTLLIDADPQGDSTDTYRALSIDTATLYDVILDRDDPLPIMEAIQHTEDGDIVAGDKAMKKAETALPSDGNEYFILQEALEGLTGYEYVVIDTAPTDNKLLKNCLIASDMVVIPVSPDRYSVKGLSDLNETIHNIMKRNNPKLKIAGLLLTMYHKQHRLDRDTFHTLEGIAQQMGTKLFESTIRECKKTKEAQALRMSLFKYDAGCTTAMDYLAFANELIDEITVEECMAYAKEFLSAEDYEAFAKEFLKNNGEEE